MVNYQKMYLKLFDTITDAIHILQKAQQATEELYLSTDEPVVAMFEKFHTINNDEEENSH